MILKMEKFTLFAFAEDKEKILGNLMRKKCVQINRPEDLTDYEQIQEIVGRDSAQLYELEQLQSRLSNALAALAPYEEKPALFAKKKVVSYEALSDAVVDHARDLAKEIEDNLRNTADIAAAKNSDQFLLQSIQPWKGIDIPLELSATASCRVRFYFFPVTTDLQAVQKQLDESCGMAHLEAVSEDRDQKYAAVVYHAAYEEQVVDCLKGQNAVRMTFPAYVTGTTQQVTAQIEERFALYDRYLERLHNELAALAAHAPELKLGYDAVVLRAEQQRAKANLLLTDRMFVVNGWVAQQDKPKLQSVLEHFDCFCEFAEPAPDEEAPIRLKNNKFAAPFELITEMYSLPSYNGIDPSFIMAPFFILFFGMMLSDAGYGLVLFIAGLLVLKLLKPEGTMKRMFQLVWMCGLSTVVWGAIYGGWFGNLVPQIAEVFFGKEVNIPLLLDPLTDPITIMILSFILGAIHLFTGMGVKAWLMIKRGHVWSAIFDVGLWYVTLIGLPLLLFPGVPATIGKWMAIGGAVGLILTQGRHEKNPLKKLVSGVMSLYDVTGYFSDVLSYSRILALGLATGVIANVVNIMGTLPGANVIGAIVFVLVFLLGHTLNLAINALGSYVHTSRLQYVEFFGKFYESGGSAFAPFRANTKYTMFDPNEE